MLSRRARAIASEAQAKLQQQFGSVDKAFDFISAGSGGLSDKSFEEKMVQLGATTQEGAKELFKLCAADYKGNP